MARIRPFNERELSSNDVEVVFPGNPLLFHPTLFCHFLLFLHPFLFPPFRSGSEPNSINVDTDLADNTCPMGLKTFQFDSVFDGSASQADVFAQTIPLLESSLQGYNCTIFTYGQTGTGKTHTILGHDIWSLASEVEKTNEDIAALTNDEGRRGIIPRAMQFLFSRGSRGGSSLAITLSYVEIYNETLRDLLNPTQISSSNSGKGGKGLDIRENSQGEMIVPGLSEVTVT